MKTTDKYTTARQIVQEYLKGNISEPDFKRKISDIMDIPLHKSKEVYQISDILKDRAELSLPGDKTCSECYHLPRCQALFRCNPDNRECDFYPIRFYPKVI